MVQPNFAMIHTEDQWIRASHENTSLDVENGVLQLAWVMEERAEDPGAIPSPAALAFDPWCRLYRSIPEDGQVVKSLWGDSGTRDEQPLALFEPDRRTVGDFTLDEDHAQPLLEPRGLAVDDRGCLFVAETGRSRIVVYDLVDRRLLRHVHLDHPPGDLATDGSKVYALMPASSEIAVLDARTGPRIKKLPETITAPSRIALSPNGELLVLNAGGQEQALVVPVGRTNEWIAVPYATDLEFLADDILVVARGPGQDFRRFRIQPGAQWELPYLRGRHYDGRGIVAAPDGTIGFWTAGGFARATFARVRYLTKGRMTGFRMDSGQYQTVWGRIFIDACIPKGTAVRVHCLVLDELPEAVEPLPHSPPPNTSTVTINPPKPSLLMPPKFMVESIGAMQSFHRRAQGRELSWMCPSPPEPFETYEAPVIAGAGRYLWVVLELKGSTRRTPRIKSLRVEYPSHDLLRRLPQVYSYDVTSADFLRRYLAMLEGVLRELDLRSMVRHILLDPQAAPQQVLAWLAGFIGLILDERWPPAVKRELIKNGIWLFRFRGTVMGLKRFLEIYLRGPVTIIEHFKVRGLGGAFVGGNGELASRAVLGSGFRIGGQLGEEDLEFITGQSLKDAIQTHAHRFSIVIPRSLDLEQKEVIEHILNIHRPCHTLYDMCTLDAGMKAGVSLYAALTTIVGRTAGFDQIQVGGSLLGRNKILGRALSGTRPGSSRLGGDSRIG
jgi:phage tail-like protein